MWRGFRFHESMAPFSQFGGFYLAFLLMSLIFQMTRFGQWYGVTFQKVQAVFRKLEGFMCFGI